MQPNTTGSGRCLRNERDTLPTVLLERFHNPAHVIELLLIVGHR